MFKLIKKADLILFFFLIALGLLLSWYAAAGSTDGQKAVVTVAGAPYGVYDLSTPQEVEIRQQDHINKITIKDGTVQMTYADCHNQICVHDGAIHKTGESIVCLPNRVMVEITGGEPALDGVAR